jgi:hypothetical protein
MTDMYVDSDSGEVRPNGSVPISERARPQTPPPVVNRSLNDAIEGALREVGAVWITATHKSGKGEARYAKLKDILEKVQPILLKHRIRIRQGADRSWPCDDGGGVKGRLIPVYTDLIHTVTGEAERTVIEMPLTRLDPQAMGSAITYGKRYSLLAALGLTTDEADDDGAGANPRDVTQGVKESRDAVALRAEIDAAKDATKLAEWSQNPKNVARLNKLSDDEAVLVRQHYQNKVQKLMAAE